MKHTIEQLLELQHTALVSLAELLNKKKQLSLIDVH